MKYLLLTFLIWLSISLNSKTFVREYTYRAGEADSKITARAIALEQVKRLLLEEVGVYIQSSIINKETEVNGQVSELTQKDIQVLSTGITQSKVLQETWNGETYYLKAQITLDEKDVLKQLDNLINDTKKQQALEDTRAKSDQALAQIDSLKAALAREQDKIRQMELQKAYNTEAQKLSAIEYYNKGLDSINSGDNYESSYNETTLKWFKKAVEADSTFADAWHYLGENYYSSKDYGLAKKCYLKAYQLSGYPYHLQRLGDVYDSMNDYDNALNYYQQAYDAFQKLPPRTKFSDIPENAEWERKNDIRERLEPLNRMAEIYIKQNNRDKAMEIYQRVLALNPENSHALIFTASIYLQNQQYEKAIENYYTLLRTDALPPESVYENIGYVYREKGDLTTAINFFKQSYDADPTNSMVFFYLGDCYFRLNDFTSAITMYLKLLKDTPTDGYSAYRLAQSYEAINDSANAKKYYILSAKNGIQDSQKWCTEHNLKWN